MPPPGFEPTQHLFAFGKKLLCHGGGHLTAFGAHHSRFLDIPFLRILFAQKLLLVLDWVRRASLRSAHRTGNVSLYYKLRTPNPSPSCPRRDSNPGFRMFLMKSKWFESRCSSRKSEVIGRTTLQGRMCGIGCWVLGVGD